MEEITKLFLMKIGIYGPLVGSIIILILGIQIPLITLIPLSDVIDYNSIWQFSEILCVISIFILISLSGYFYIKFRNKINKIVKCEGKKDED